MTYGVVKPSDNLVIVDDSIVRGTTLRKEYFDHVEQAVNPKQIVVVSSAPQIRYPDCYGIDMAKLEDFIAFQAAIALHEEKGNLKTTLDAIYANCQDSVENDTAEAENHVKALYAPFAQ